MARAKAVEGIEPVASGVSPAPGRFREAAASCLDGWRRYGAATIPDPRLRRECESRTRALCRSELAATGTLCAVSAACALHCLLGGGVLEADALSAVNRLASRWLSLGIAPAYSGGAPTPSSVLELYGAAAEALEAMRHPQAGQLQALKPGIPDAAGRPTEKDSKR